jgi:glycosyltransferase involved in cell wall biosynthesis
MTELTVVICTYNRAESLEDTLEHLCLSTNCDRLRWELLLVDNNCSDHTPQVAERFSGRLPLRYLLEPTQGLSHARNRALREAQGNALVFTDDDVRPLPEWLSAYADAFRDYSQAEYFGGRIIPWWPQGKPNWVRDINMALLSGLFVSYDLGGELHWYSPEEMHPYGANFALRRSLFERLEPFRIDLGASGNIPGRGEEAEYLQRARTAGARGLYVPAAAVLHRVDAYRLRLAHLYEYGVQKGIASQRMNPRCAVPGRFAEGTYLAKGLWQLLKGRGDRFRQCVINMGIVRGARGHA